MPAGWSRACTSSRAWMANEREAAMQFIRPRQVLEMIGVSRVTLWRMVQAGTFPRPVQITERNRAYLRDAVEAWMKARVEGLPLKPAAPAAQDRRRGKRASLASVR